MLRQDLILQTRDVLARTGFYLSDKTDSRMICFDIVARRDNILIILKVLANVDSFSKRNAQELSILSEMLNGIPMIIGEHTTKKKIESGIVYFRHGIPLVNFNTLNDFFIEGVPPLIFSAPGGFYVNIDSEVLKAAREKKNISLGTLAEIAGVSRKAIQMYENGMSTVLDVALRLEEYLDIPLIRPFDPFTFKTKSDITKMEFDSFSGIEEEVFNQLKDLGYNVVPIAHCPFDALSKDKRILIITGICGQNKRIAEKARVMSNISKITEHYSVMFLDRGFKRENLEGTPIICKEELKKLADSDDIITLISERR